MDTALTTPTSDISLQGLSFLWLEITGKCNLECVHCYADSGPRQDLFGCLKTEDWLNILSESARLGCRQVQFIGGEPTLHPDLPRMISFASTQGYTFIEVFTNATALTDSLLSTFAEFGVHIATSFYSDMPEVHDSITKRPGSFERTVMGIKRAISAGLPLRAGIIEMQENAGHAAKAEQFLRSIGISEIKIDYQRGVGRGANPLHSLDPMAELCGECWKGKLCVTSLGRVYPCVFSRFADLGSTAHGVRNILNTDVLKEFRTTLREYRRKKETAKGVSIENSSNNLEQQSIPFNSIGLRIEKCDPESCPPDTDSDCNPMVFGPCPPGVMRPCSPDEACGPNTIELAMQMCNPDCSPNTGSDCGPVSFCVPKCMCAPDNPRPCQPATTCAPRIQASKLTITE